MKHYRLRLIKKNEHGFKFDGVILVDEGLKTVYKKI